MSLISKKRLLIAAMAAAPLFNPVVMSATEHPAPTRATATAPAGDSVKGTAPEQTGNATATTPDSQASTGLIDSSLVFGGLFAVSAGTALAATKKRR